MGPLTAGVAALKVLFRHEELPPPPLRPPPSAGRGTLSRLLMPDPLPPDLPAAPRRPARWLGWLFRPERLEP